MAAKTNGRAALIASLFGKRSNRLRFFHPTQRSGRCAPGKGAEEAAAGVFGGEKKCLTYSHIGMYCCAHGTSGDNFGCIQRGGGAAAAGNPELSCTARTACGGDCGLSGA